MPLLDLDVRSEAPGHDSAGGEVLARRRDSRPFPWAVALAGVAVAVGAVLRFVAPSPLWLDEAQAVAIAQLPPGALLEALRSDGAPPLWYLLLHGWIRLAGSGASAVRVLPMALGLTSLGLAWRAGVAAGGRRVGLVLTVLVATSPFAIRYSSEARMYALVLVLVLLGTVAVLERHRDAARWRPWAIAGVTGALLLTHYWSAFLVVAVAVLLGVEAVTSPSRRAGAVRTVGAMAAGSLVFLPWLPSFLHQLERTGAPWGRPPGFAVLEVAVRGFAGGRELASVLEVLLLLAAGAAVAVPFLRGRRSSGDPAALVAVAAATLLLGALALQASGDAFAPRHAMVAFAPLMTGIALLTTELRRRPAAVAVGAMAVVGLATAMMGAGADRTQAGDIAAAVRAGFRPGDVIAACPDQLTPALARLLEPSLRPQRSLPGGSPAEWVDWTDYAARVAAADPEVFAAALHEEAGAGTIWLVASPNYAGIGRRCTALEASLRRLRPGTTREVRLRRDVFENATLWRAPAPTQPPPA